MNVYLSCRFATNAISTKGFDGKQLGELLANPSFRNLWFDICSVEDDSCIGEVFIRNATRLHPVHGRACYANIIEVANIHIPDVRLQGKGVFTNLFNQLLSMEASGEVFVAVENVLSPVLYKWLDRQPTKIKTVFDAADIPTMQFNLFQNHKGD